MVTISSTPTGSGSTVTVTVKGSPAHSRPDVLIGVTVYTTVWSTLVVLVSSSVIVPPDCALVLSPVTSLLSAAIQLKVLATPFPPSTVSSTFACRSMASATLEQVVATSSKPTGSDSTVNVKVSGDSSIQSSPSPSSFRPSGPKSYWLME